ncbi:MAG: TrkH family potassium uptake protein [bacterium]
MSFFTELSPAWQAIFGFLVVITIGALLLMLPVSTVSEGGMSFTNAFFTSTSAVCVTGLIVVDTGTVFTFFGQLVIISLIQIGGIGIILASSFLIIGFKKSLSMENRFELQENFANWNFDKVKQALKRVFILLFLVEAGGAAILTYSFSKTMPFFNALWHGVFHSISATCNAGFSLNADSLVGYQDNALVVLSVAGLIVIGGLGFIVLAELISGTGEQARYTLHTRVMLWGTAILITGGTLSFAFLHPESSWLDYIFQSITTRTAGFNSIDLRLWSTPAMLIMMVLMFIGAGPSSTAGGIKITTVAILLSNLWARIRHHRNTHLLGRKLNWKQVHHALILFFIALFIVMFFVFALTITEDSALEVIMFEVFSALGTVGLSLGITPELTTAGRWLIIFAMYLGRLGPLTIALVLIKPARQEYTYPEERMLIG